MKKNVKLGILALVLVVLFAIFFAMRPSTDKGASAVNLTGAGSTFAIPLLDECKAGYTATSGNTFTYSGGGSGAGRSASDMGIGDFNFSDTPHTANTRLATVIHVPVIAAPIAVMYKMDLAKPLNLSPSTVAGIFAGTISKWNDPAVIADNPGVQLPSEKIQVIYRSDSSGTSGNFTAFLYGMAPAIWSNPGSNDFKASFPGNIDSSANLGRIVSAAGSSGVSSLAGSTPYSITYAEKNYADAAGLSEANIGNRAGNFVAPDAAGTSAFLGAAAVDPNGFLTFDYETMEPGAYPLGIVSYALVDTKGKHASDVKGLLTYLLSPACSNANPALGYSAITGALHDLDVSQIAKIG
ncbi:MAG TPA: substrate-binding domain-containing protein [Candidatus Paceibacterota bacterium]|nr:substrate-binding domain-containing protein [Candidatus Paceibacterota bacterium]